MNYGRLEAYPSQSPDVSRLGLGWPALASLGLSGRKIKARPSPASLVYFRLVKYGFTRKKKIE